MNEKYINAADCEKFFYDHLDDNGMKGALNAIEEMPAADVEPVKHGHWIVADDGVTRCSICYGASDYERSFCGDCGAKMDLKDVKIDRDAEKIDTNKLLNKQKEKMKDAIKISYPDYETGHEMADDILCETLTLLGFKELVTLFKDVNRMYSF
ncbi:MAG: hypothetical protein K6F27_13525 [Ruminococcus sp.]|nr:hypothetical protein [Ruminococcus sp.]